jgi:transketolase
MRKQFVSTLKTILYNDKNSVLLLGDIGVFGFREELKNISSRVYNIGILEQSTISLAAGLSRSGMIPFVHTISPFIVERALEQLKIDFGYQNLCGNFITVGNSYDYAALGCTHHCPADIQLMLSIPTMKIFIPGNSEELDHLISLNYNNGSPNYYRLGENENKKTHISENNKCSILKTGSKATIVCFGNMLDVVQQATENMDITLLYYNTIHPFDSDTLLNNFNETIIICEPFYEGTTNYLINNALITKSFKTYNIGVPRKFLRNYGTKKEHDVNLMLDVDGISKRISTWIL